ncbi:DNA modification methylase [Longilinea arvoryzae]|uniref:Methyltransferase n=1 Tax=Longilinea arvoryzae TaxID=360412 RepID=A0A0S7BBJ3_9CHLR|nr:DNA methyltransferase [Longilinea arvoryzae]GAP12457.1 DNA modification methylase [Longilinea arvoryzae]
MDAPDLPINQVLEGDCIDVLQRLPAESIDLIFADPPYNLQLRRELWRPNLTLVDGVDDAWDQFGSFADYDAFTTAWLSACRRVLKRSGTLWVIGSYHNIYRVGARLQDLGFWILNDVVWIKSNPTPNFRGVRFTNAHETLVWAQKERGATYTFNHHAMRALNEDKQMRSDWMLPICTGRERLRVNGQKAHTTQKPEALLYRVLLASSNPGDVVLDPFFGTGTTGVVARRLNRRWIGIERDPKYAALARERIAASPPPGSAPGVYASHNPRRETRLPFGALLENNLLQPGDPLYFGEQSAICARVQADGSLEYNGQRGSIHKIARSLHPGPCNGWQLWFYEDAGSRERRPIDLLRQQLRDLLKSSDEGEK